MRRLIPLLAVLAAAALPLAACGEKGDKDVLPPGSEPQPDPGPGPAGPPVEKTLAMFVGTWAAQPGLCSGGAWEVKPEGLDTAGEISCSWTPGDERSVDGGVAVEAVCHAEGEETRDTLTLSGDHDNLTISGGPFTPVPLARCNDSAR